MPNLLRKPGAAPHLQSIDPEAVAEDCPNWTYVAFDVIKLEAGQTLERETGDWEHLLVIVTGKMHARVGEEDLGELGGRMDIHAREKGWSLYVPNGKTFAIRAETELELALCAAPGAGTHPVRVIAPDDAPMEARGTGANTRYVNAIMMEDKDWADALLVTEVWTPNGNWSSYPSHKHDQDNFPEETYLEETYYHKINPPTGFSVQRVYNDDRSLDETMAVGDGDVVLVPEGYHPAVALYGHDLYYLNVMAGPLRKWRFKNDPDHDWVFQRDSGTR
ncbi:MAG: 5-deoxy-glucuronate isomerase [Pseudomonadota bacterium]